MWEISNNSQIFNFVLAVALGVIFCVAYDILRALRACFHISVIAVFLQDIIYFAISAFVTFCFLLISTNGELRLYIILGLLFGFFILRLTLSLYIYRLLNLIFAKLGASISKVLNAIFGFLKKRTVKFDIFLKNMIKTLKKVLKKKRGKDILT